MDYTDLQRVNIGNNLSRWNKRAEYCQILRNKFSKPVSVPKHSFAFLVGKGKYGVFMNDGRYFIHEMEKDGMRFSENHMTVFPEDAYGDLCYLLGTLLGQDTDITGLSYYNDSIDYRHDIGGACSYNANIFICFLKPESWKIDIIINVKGDGRYAFEKWHRYIIDNEFSNSSSICIEETTKNHFKILYMRITGFGLSNSCFSRNIDGTYRFTI